MSTLSRIKIWISGDLLTAGDLNSEFNNIINDYNGSINMSNISASISPTWTGTHTFGSLKLTGAGAGIATLTNANTATNRTITLPDPGADSTLVALAGAQTITGAKTFSGGNTLILPTVAPSTNAAIGVDSGILKVHDGTIARSYVTISTAQTISGQKLFSLADTLRIPTGVTPTVSGSICLTSNILHVHDGTTNHEYVDLDSVQTLTNKTITGASTDGLDATGQDKCKIPALAPTVDRSLAVVSGVLQCHDGTAARSYCRLDNTQTISGNKTLSGTNTISGATTFNSTMLKIAGAGAGVATLTNANTATSRTLTLPDATDTVCGIAATQTLTNKTLTTPTIADLTNMTHLHTSNAEGGVLSTSAITSGTFADARISSSSVTQHEASLSIAETQITDGTVLARVGSNETITGNWTFSGADAIILPTTDPTTNAGVGFANDILKIHDGTSAKSYFPIEKAQQGLYNIAFAQGTDSSILKITAANGSALSASNPGYVRIHSSTAGTFTTFTVTSDINMDLTGCHWGFDAKGDTTNTLLSVYAINDAGALSWGVGLFGGFDYCRSTQDSTTATNINLPEEIYVNSDVGTDNSPARNVGWIKASFTDSSNDWAISEYHPNESCAGHWQPFNPSPTGFSSFTTENGEWTWIGKTIIARYNISGTSNATSFTFSSPYKAESTIAGDNNGLMSSLTNNGVNGTTPGRADITDASVTIDLYRDLAGLGWTSSGTKFASGTIIYRAYQP